MNLSNIKCIIWDLDNTLWKGTLMEDDIIILEKARELIIVSSEVGIIHAICSKNDENRVNEKLRDLSIDNYFVFNSINYEAKGLRVKNQIEMMNLRAENVLFIDDEISNLKEASFYCPNIMISQPYVIEELLSYYRRLFDEGKRCNRIEQYRSLEKKKNFRRKYGSNEEFLQDSNIFVEIKKNCEEEFERIYELCHRTNQLNFTKKRPGREEFLQEIINAESAGYVTASDRYGDYGIVGFYLIVHKKLKHFFFSCRIMNMGIEQYIYEKLDNPQLDIVGQVASKLGNIKVTWINNGCKEIKNNNTDTKLKVLLKGSCDFRRMKLFLPDNIIYEVPYISCGKNIVYQTGIPTMAMTLKHPIETIRQRTLNLPFYSMEYYSTKLFEKNYDMVILSTISLANLGVYLNKENDFFISMGLPEEPMYMKEHEIKYASEGKYANGFNNTGSMFEQLRNDYTYIYDRYLDDYLEEHLTAIIQNISAKKIILVLGNEEIYSENKTRAGRFFSKANRIIEKICIKNECTTINLSDFIENADDVIGHFNHFSSLVYYKLSVKIRDIIKEMEDE